MTLTNRQIIVLAREAAQAAVDCGGEPEPSPEDALSFVLQMWLEDDQIDADTRLTRDQRTLYTNMFRQFRDVAVPSEQRAQS